MKRKIGWSTKKHKTKVVRMATKVKGRPYFIKSTPK